MNIKKNIIFNLEKKNKNGVAAPLLEYYKALKILKRNKSQ